MTETPDVETKPECDQLQVMIENLQKFIAGAALPQSDPNYTSRKMMLSYLEREVLPRIQGLDLTFTGGTKARDQIRAKVNKAFTY